MADSFYPFVENPSAGGGDLPEQVTCPARVAVYDSASAAPRVVVVEPKDIRNYLEEITATVTKLAHEQGGSIPFTVIRECVENLIHAYFKEPTVSILDGGDTIRFSDQGPGIADKTLALEYGTSSATEEMKRYIRGVGSGLPYAQQYMSEKGGSLTIEDNISAGTVVTISLHHGLEATVDGMAWRSQEGQGRLRNAAADPMTAQNPWSVPEVAVGNPYGRSWSPQGQPIQGQNPWAPGPQGNPYGTPGTDPWAGQSAALPQNPSYWGQPPQGWPQNPQGQPWNTPGAPGSGAPWPQSQSQGGPYPQGLDSPYAPRASQGMGTDQPSAMGAPLPTVPGIEQTGVSGTGEQAGSQRPGGTTGPMGSDLTAGASFIADAQLNLNDNELAALRYLSAHEAVGPTELVHSYGSSNSTWSRCLADLKARGLIRKMGQKHYLTDMGVAWLRSHPLS